MVTKWKVVTEGGFYAAVRPGCEAVMEVSIWRGYRRIVLHSQECSAAPYRCVGVRSLPEALAYVDRAVMEDRFHAPALEAPC